MSHEEQKSNQEWVIAGTDVGKAHLDVHIASTCEARQFPNDAGGQRGLRKMLHKAGFELVVVEAIGRYHRKLHGGLHACGLPVAVVSPLRTRRFAQAVDEHANRRLRWWLCRKHKVKSGEYVPFSKQRLWHGLGLVNPAPTTKGFRGRSHDLIGKPVREIRTPGLMNGGLETRSREPN